MKKRSLVLVGWLVLFLLPVLFFSPALSSAAEEQEWVPGQVLVRVEDGTSAESVKQLAESVGVTDYKKITSWDLYRFDFDPTLSVEEMVEKLQADARVRYAEANRIMKIQKEVLAKERT